MDSNEKLEALLRVVSEIAKDVRAMREELEWQRENRERDWQQVAPLTGTWTEPEDTGTPYRTGWVHHVSKGGSD